MQPAFYIIGLVVLLLVLYLFQRAIIQYFSLVSFLLFGTSKIGVYLFFIFFLPGVILHELSHLFTASVLGVPTGKIMVFPHKDDRGWTLGQVASAETDILRSSLIGLAPMIIGTASLFFLVNMGLGVKSLANINQVNLFSRQTALFLYFILAFSNTMFLSKEDRTSIWAFPSLLVFLFLFARAMGLASVLNASGVLTLLENIFYQIVSSLILSFALTVIIDFFFLIPFWLITEILVRLRG